MLSAGYITHVVYEFEPKFFRRVNTKYKRGHQFGLSKKKLNLNFFFFLFYFLRIFESMIANLTTSEWEDRRK